MLLLLGKGHFSVKIMNDFYVSNECITDQPTDQRTEPTIKMRGRIL